MFLFIKMTYSSDFRRKVLTIKEKERLSFGEVSKRFGIAVNTVFLWSKRLEAKETRNKPATKIDMEALKHDIEAYPDAYHHERAARLGVSKNGIWHALRRLKVTYKKKPEASSGQPRRSLCLLPRGQQV